MKDIFKRVATWFRETEFIYDPPRYQLSLSEKSYLRRMDYIVTRDRWPIIYSPYGAFATEDFDHVKHKDGTTLTRIEFDHVNRLLESHRTQHQDDTPHPKGNG